MTPSDATIESGTSVEVTCATVSTGAPITYNFFKDGNSIISQSGDTYTMGSISTADSGTYTCTVTMNSVTSLASSGHTIGVVGEYMVNVESFVRLLSPVIVFYII